MFEGLRFGPAVSMESSYSTGRFIFLMTDENQPKPAVAPFIRNDDERAAPHSGEATALRHKIAGLLTQAHLEAEQPRDRIADILAQEEALREITKNKDSLEALVLKLRDANQSLVMASLNAQDMQAKAEAANHRQEEFLSMLAHELRNPLAPISLAVELLESIAEAHPLLPKIHGIIGRQLNHLTRLVDDLVDASRVNSGKITLQKRALLLSDIIDSAIETSQPFIDKRNQHLTLDLPAESVVIDGDLVRLAQVFSNLLINATKFTPEHGHIAVSARMLPNAVAVSVTDDGVGIAQEIQPFIFDLFTQGPRSLDRSQGGLGIGLSLVRTIAEMHGGAANVESAGAGLGSKFTVQLPISIASLLHDSKSPVKAVLSRPRRILLIEDNVDANEILNNFLALEGHTMTSAFDGKTGLAMAKENNYDVIVCDIGLPGMNGYEVIKQLRQDTLKPVPYLIAMTGYNQLEHRSNAMDAGFDHYLVKPVTMELLRNLISWNAM